MLGLIKEFSPTLNEDDGLCLYISHAMFLIEFFILTKSNIIKILFFNLFCRKVLRETADVELIVFHWILISYMLYGVHAHFYCYARMNKMNYKFS